MAESITFSAADQALCLAVLKQVQVGNVDYELLRAELNLPSKNAAQIRWSRFNTKLRGGVPASKSTGARRGRPSTTTGKVTKGKTKGKPKSKKRKMDFSDDDEEDEVDMIATDDKDEDMKEEGEEETGLMTPFQTPTRKLPTRKARVTTFKEGASDDDEEQEQEGEDEDEAVDVKEEFHDSGHGGTETGPSDVADASDDEV